jgi:hypothetical protein
MDDVNMSTGTTASPHLPNAPAVYDRAYQDVLNNILRLYFSQLDNPGNSAASGLNLNISKLPTEVEEPDLRPGDVYRDTATNVLKIKV